MEHRPWSLSVPLPRLVLIPRYSKKQSLQSELELGRFDGAVLEQERDEEHWVAEIESAARGVENRVGTVEGVCMAVVGCTVDNKDKHCRMDSDSLGRAVGNTLVHTVVVVRMHPGEVENCLGNWFGGQVRLAWAVVDRLVRLAGPAGLDLVATVWGTVLAQIQRLQRSIVTSSMMVRVKLWFSLPLWLGHFMVLSTATLFGAEFRFYQEYLRRVS